jgi:purine-binding chemotaxis protein CheW
MTNETSEAGADRLTQRKDILQVVSFRLHEESYAIEITRVKEIILVEGITRVPQMPEYIEGIINLRGNVIPVVDLRKRFGLPCRPLDEQTRIVVCRMGERVVGLIVDSVSQVMKIPRERIQEPPATIAGHAGDYLVGVARIGEGLVLLLDIETVLARTPVAEPATVEAVPAGAGAPQESA